MIKNITILLVLIIQNSYGQTVSTSLKVEYDEFRIYNPAIVNIDLGILLVNGDKSYYNIKFSRQEKKGTILADDVIVVDSGKKVFSDYIINKKYNSLTEFLTETRYLKKKYAVSETIPLMTWTLNKETKTLKNFVCRKATTTFRGRFYEVWYTDKIPVSAGPWKFNGLPGLILYVKESKGIYSWAVKSIVYPWKGDIQNEISQKIEDKAFTKITLQAYDNLRIGAMKQKIEMVKVRSSERSGGGASLSLTTESEKEPFYPWRPETIF